MSGAAAIPLAQRLRDRALDWLVPDWPVPGRVNGFVTTRNGGVSRGVYATLNLGRGTQDDPVCVAENERRTAAFLPSAPIWLRQVHGAAVAVLDAAADARRPTADAAVTRVPGVVCAVQVADCLPVLFADRRGTAVGVAHAGWRGLAAGVLEAAVATLVQEGARQNDVVAWLGPAIGPAAFEVGRDVYDAFVGRDPALASCFVANGGGKWLADLYAIARARLARCGVAVVRGGGHCTKTESERFFSYRRERESGRMAALVWLTPNARGSHV